MDGMTAAVIGDNKGMIENSTVLSGEIYMKTTINNCYVGGLVAWNSGSVKKCYNKANVKAINLTASSWSIAGGICGGNDTGVLEKQVINCYNMGSIETIHEGASGRIAVGGILGYSTNGVESLKNCYNVGTISYTN